MEVRSYLSTARIGLQHVFRSRDDVDAPEALERPNKVDASIVRAFQGEASHMVLNTSLQLKGTQQCSFCFGLIGRA